jgi:hypothetical protein
MGNLPPLLDLICGLRTGRRLSDQPGAGFGGRGWIGAEIWYLVLQVLAAEVAPRVAVGKAWVLPVR